MERLTVKRKDGRWALRRKDGISNMEQMKKIPLAYARLAAYEDTGLEPEQIAFLASPEGLEMTKIMKSVLEDLERGTADVFGVEVKRIEELAEAEKDGRLVVLPYKDSSSSLGLLLAECERQDKLWGDQSGNHPFEWISILGEEYGELCEAVNETCFKNPHHPERGGYRAIILEATHVAAVALHIMGAMLNRENAEAAPEKKGDTHEANPV